MILNSIYAIVGFAYLVSWILLVVQVYKIKNKLLSQEKPEVLAYELKVAETAGNKQRASELCVRLLFHEYDKKFDLANSENNIDELKQEMKIKYYDRIIALGGTWPAEM